MSTIALFAALGGGAYAAATIGPDDIQRNAVRSKHITNADLVDGVDSADLMRGRGRTVATRGTDAPGGAASAPLNLADGQFTLECQNPASVGSNFVFKNTGAAAADVWTDKVQDGFAIEHQIFYTSVPSSGTATVMVSGPSLSADGRSSSSPSRPPAGSR
jgi:hypothetical protein